MEFTYKTYFTTTLLIPLSFIALLIVAILGVSYGYWLKLPTKRHTINESIGYIFCLCAFIWCLIPQCRYLFNGGFFLIQEKERNALNFAGSIESIIEPSERFPGYKAFHNYGADIVIDGELFFIVSSGDYKEGDSVTVRFLPDSHFILDIQKADTN